jgi:universal stress protein A
MFTFRRILVAADFSEASREAFRAACALARESETRVTVLHVAEPPLVYGELGVEIPLSGDRRAVHEALVKRLRESYVPSRPLRLDYLARDGGTAEQLLAVAEELGYDLIAMGTHGRAGLTRLLAGSVAETVLRKAHCPVLALRMDDRGTAAPEVPDGAHSAG